MYDGTLVRLRAMEPADAAAHQRWFTDRDVVRYLQPRYPVSLPACEERLAERAPMSFAAARFSVDRLDSGELIGFVALRDAEPENRDAELDLVIGEKSLWGKGYGSDALRVLCRFGFEQMALHRIHLLVFTEHDAAIRVYDKLGFVREGVQRHACFKDGRWHDWLMMSLLEGELG